MKKTDKKIEDFWDGLEVRKPDDDRELQRKAVLATGAVLGKFFSVVFKVFLLIAAIIFVLMWLSSAYHLPPEYHGERHAEWGGPTG
jgi:hypothetical protein